MAKPTLLLTLVQVILVHGLLASGPKRSRHNLHERAIALSSDVAVTTSYTSTVSTLQSATVTASPSATGVCSKRRFTLRSTNTHANRAL